MTPEQRRALVLASKHRTIEGKLVRLVPSKPEHAAEMCRLRNQPRAISWLLQGGELGVEQQTAWILRTDAKDDDISWTVFDRAGRAIGTNALYDIDAEGDGAEKGRLTVDEAVGLEAPYALESDLLLIGFALGELGLRAIRTRVRHDNLKMQSMNARLGFERVGEHIARGVPHIDQLLRRDSFDPRPLDAIIDHWSKRHERGKAQATVRRESQDPR